MSERPVDSPGHNAVSDQELAEVIDLIDQLHADPATREQALALCRTVSTLAGSPKLALHGIVKLIRAGRNADRQKVITALDCISELQPALRWLQFQCGYHYGELDALEKGIICYQRAIALKPTAKSHYQIAQLYKRQMQFEPAIEHLEAAIGKNPGYPGAAGELLYIMSMKGDLMRFEELAADPAIDRQQLAKSYNRLGQTLVYMGDRPGAMQWFDKAITLEPDSFSLQWSKELTVPTVYRSDADLARSRQQYLTGLENISAIYDELPAKEKDRAQQCAQKLTNFEIHYQSENDLEVQRPYGALLDKIMRHSLPRYFASMPRRHPGNSRRIRVGFASWGCFFTHSNYKTHGSWLTDLDRDRFEVFGYALAPHHDQATTRMQKAVEHFVPHSMPIPKLRDRILDDALDILVYPGIGMEPVVHRLAPLRLAPVQCTSWGHPVTSGLPNIDYFLSSDLMEPDNAQANYTETLVRLPNLGISQIAPGLPVKYRPPAVLENRKRPQTVFLCSQNLLKMMPRHDFLFARILQTVPDSEIWFIRSKREEVSATFARRLAKTCQSYGVDFAERCLMLPRLGKAEFCYVNAHADVMLDTSFWSGCNTTFETLVHQTPVITLPGNTMRGRHTWAILKLHGLEELICSSEQEYVALAARLATDGDFYSATKNRIAAIQGQLFGDSSVIEALQSFFERSLTGDV